MKIKTDYRDCHYITPGKEYVVVESGPHASKIVHDEERVIWVRNPGGVCAHLNDEGTWQVVEEQQS